MLGIPPHRLRLFRGQDECVICGSNHRGRGHMRWAGIGPRLAPSTSFAGPLPRTRGRNPTVGSTPGAAGWPPFPALLGLSLVAKAKRAALPTRGRERFSARCSPHPPLRLRASLPLHAALECPVENLHGERLIQLHRIGAGRGVGHGHVADLVTAVVGDLEIDQRMRHAEFFA